MRVLLTDDHPVMVGIREVLEQSDGFEVVGEARDGREVLSQIGRTRPDVVLLNPRMPAIDGLSCIERIRLKYPNVKVIVLSIPADQEEQAALLRGDGEYVVRAISSLDLPSALRQAVEGPVYLAIGRPDVDETLILEQSGLTKRELTIVKAVARGLSNQAIAKELWVTEQTVKFHLTNIYRKLGVSNRTGAARWAYAQGLSGAGLYEAVGDNRH